MEKDKLKKIEFFGDRFKQEYRGVNDKDKLLNDWKYSLEFFFDHSFMRGRNDELSIKFEEIAIGVLKNTIFEDINYDLELLDKQLLEAGVNNHGDRIMVIESIKFIKNIENNNITAHFVKKLKISEKEAYDELIQIKYVADKIITFYFRELCWKFEIKIKDYGLIFPIDTWVKQIINRLKILDEKILSDEELKKVNNEEVKEKTIKICLENDINPLKFNAGIWYLGKHSLEILLDNLDKLNDFTNEELHLTKY
jgi:hypothetical protein